MTMRVPRGADRTQIEADLAVERALRKAMVVNSRDLVLFFEPDGTITWASDAARQLFDIEPTDLVGRSGFDLIDPRDRDRVLERFITIPGLGDSVTVEFRVRLPSGETRWIEESATNFLEDPSVGVIVGNLRDVTDRRRREDELRFTSDLLASVGQPVIACDQSHRVVYWNAAATEVFGWNFDEVLGMDIRELLPFSEPERAVDAVNTIHQLRAPWSGELSVRTKGGGQTVVAASITPRWNGATYEGYIAVSVDMSDRAAREELSARLAAIVDATTDAIYSIDVDGHILTWNQGATAIYGYTESEVVGRHVAVLVPSERREELADLIDAVLSGAEIQSYHTLRQRKDGRTFDVSASLSPVLDAAGSVVSIAVISRDITEQVDLVRSAEVQRQQLLDAQRTANLGSFVLDLDTGHVERSDELWRILGVAPGALPHLDWDHVHPDDLEKSLALFERVRAGDLEVSDTYRILRPDGEVRWVSARLSGPVPHSPRKVGGTILDVTATKAHELELERLAFSDSLTGLANREGLTRQVARRLDLAATDGETALLAMLDIDDFKGINDNYGHGVGDRVLQVLAERLTAVMSTGAIIGRFASDQFVVVSTGSDPVDLVTDALHEAVRVPLEAGSHTFHLTASIGLALCPPGSTVDSALQDADVALQRAKDAGRDRTVVFDERLRAAVSEAHTLEIDLKQALREGSLRLAYQPIIALDTRRTIGFEALVRWNHPEKGPIAPSQFIPLAEHRGLIRQIGAFTLTTAISQLASWIDLVGPSRTPWLAVNLSAEELRSTGLVAEIEALLEQSNVPPNLLHLELTETAMMHDLERSLETLRSLDAMGIQLDIDDFGTGYSSLSHLRRLPISTLKIDRSFVSEVAVDQHDQAIARTIVALARQLGMSVHAEGVETAEQLAVLTRLGCDRAQGFFWSPALESDEAAIWLTRARSTRRDGLATGSALAPGPRSSTQD